MVTINILDKKTYTQSEIELLQPKKFLILWYTKCKKRPPQVRDERNRKQHMEKNIVTVVIRFRHNFLQVRSDILVAILDDWLTVHRSITLVDFQLDAQNSYLFIYNTFIKILYML